MRDVFIAELANLNPSIFVSKWILERIPHVFGADQLRFNEWKRALADKIGVDPCAIALTGSASVGISLNPNKHFREFDERSDIDVAIISSYHFEVAWRYLRNMKSEYYRLGQGARRSVDDHKTKYVYFGTIATDQILEHLPYGKEWLVALSDMAKLNPTEGREIKARVYRDFESLRGYQVSNVRKLSNDVISTRAQRGQR
jgi:hypothetical protein